MAFFTCFRSLKHHSSGRRGRRCDNDRLSPTVVLTRLKNRVSERGFVEVCKYGSYITCMLLLLHILLEKHSFSAYSKITFLACSFEITVIFAFALILCYIVLFLVQLFLLKLFLSKNILFCFSCVFHIVKITQEYHANRCTIIKNFKLLFIRLKTVIYSYNGNYFHKTDEI